MNKKYNIAVIGATGNTGRETLNILAERKFPINKIEAIASSDSLGTKISFGNDELIVSRIESIDFSKIDLAFFAAGSEIAKNYAEKIVRQGCIVIDKSSYFRTDPQIPLIVPEANLLELKNYKNKNIIASPNCCTIPLAVALKPLDNAAKIKRIVVSTYQSTSGVGRIGMDELYNQTKTKYLFGNVSSSIFPKQIAFNLFPHIGDFESHNISSEEQKITDELKKIIGDHVSSSVTCVRVPTFVGHALSVNVEFDNYINANEAEEILAEADGVYLLDREVENNYSTPIDVVGDDAVHIGRVRDDFSKPNTINLWIVADNLRKGAGLNSVQIAEHLIKLL